MSAVVVELGLRKKPDVFDKWSLIAGPSIYSLLATSRNHYGMHRFGTKWELNGVRIA